jgi:hypothetical protein
MSPVVGRQPQGYKKLTVRFYNQPHSYYCGIELHARSMFSHILDAQGQTVLEWNLPSTPEAFLDAFHPYRQGIVVGCEVSPGGINSLKSKPTSHGVLGLAKFWVGTVR